MTNKKQSKKSPAKNEVFKTSSNTVNQVSRPSENAVYDKDDNIVDFQDQTPPKFPFLFRRFLEITILSILCSAPFALVYLVGLPNNESLAFKVLGLSLIAFVISNTYFLRSFYYGMGNRIVYFKVNLIAFIMFSALNLILVSVLGDNSLHSLYSFLFMPAKLFTLFLNRILGANSSHDLSLISAIITNLLMILVVVAAPLEMYKLDNPKGKIGER